MPLDQQEWDVSEVACCFRVGGRKKIYAKNWRGLAFQTILLRCPKRVGAVFGDPWRYRFGNCPIVFPGMIGRQ